MNQNLIVPPPPADHDAERRKRKLFEIYKEELGLDNELSLSQEEMTDLMAHVLSVPLPNIHEMADSESLPASLVSIARALAKETTRGATKTTEMLLNRVYGSPEMRLKMDQKVSSDNAIPQFKTREEAEEYLRKLM